MHTLLLFILTGANVFSKLDYCMHSYHFGVSNYFLYIFHLFFLFWLYFTELHNTAWLDLFYHFGFKKIYFSLPLSLSLLFPSRVQGLWSTLSATYCRRVFSLHQERLCFELVLHYIQIFLLLYKRTKSQIIQLFKKKFWSEMELTPSPTCR